MDYSIPPGFERCAVCGEYHGTTRATHLNWLNPPPSVVGNVQVPLAVRNYYDTIIHEAAALLESLVQNHPFVDGNKRVAFAVIDVFLRINGYSITADSKTIYHYIIMLFEQRTFDMEHLVPWLQEIVEPRSAPPR